MSELIWLPMPWGFVPVWMVLYVLMSIVAWLILHVRGLHRNQIRLTMFISQMLLNALWVSLFFVWQLSSWVFTDIVALWLFIAAWPLFSNRNQTFSRDLLLQYFLWVSFGTVFNSILWYINSML